MRLWWGWDFETLQEISHNDSMGWSSICRAVLPAFTCYLLGAYKATGKGQGEKIDRTWGRRGKERVEGEIPVSGKHPLLWGQEKREDEEAQV